VNQFLSESFLESKINFCVSLITAIKNLDAKLNVEKKPKVKAVAKSKLSNESLKEVPLNKQEKGNFVSLLNSNWKSKSKRG